MITRKTDYAIRCVQHLAETEKDIVMLNEIAVERNIPKSFLAKILQTLVKAGIVESLRGVKGGFKLAKNPEDICLLDVVEIMEGSVAANICAADKRKCDLSSSCSVHPVWVEIRKDMEDCLKQWNFAKLSTVKRQ